MGGYDTEWQWDQWNCSSLRVLSTGLLQYKEQPVDDDLKLYKETAHLREIESDTEEQDSEGSWSIESLRSYWTDTIQDEVQDIAEHNKLVDC